MTAEFDCKNLLSASNTRVATAALMNLLITAKAIGLNPTTHGRDVPLRIPR
ncbi:MAG: hypothetical protein AAF628_37375 [Planctomycetota bacterium]